jgi:hypothetical protein
MIYRVWAWGPVRCYGAAMHPTVEERLTDIAERAALVRRFAELAARDEEPTDSSALNGVSAVCSDIERMADAIRKGLPPGALALSVRA